MEAMFAQVHVQPTPQVGTKKRKASAMAENDEGTPEVQLCFSARSELN
eukprot:CAMPEP_0206271266 /NCGR_PEP_ID=MMETSP0047_2-20121206/33338_1 /ASSEMBLY_ACC=CAM_ASM_000192 /TAXON_ID=195065 /ORGANISM="Chroomonas mesostigmatica_cf, Strain CCMP1168" /LENGTH=47 /DNA_ID= /DNA_START= /DNA_END= /DNA_ORIENTATION=